MLYALKGISLFLQNNVYFRNPEIVKECKIIRHIVMNINPIIKNVLHRNYDLSVVLSIFRSPQRVINLL